jgi:hypothetical protein
MDPAQIRRVILFPLVIQALPLLEFQGDAASADSVALQFILEVCPNCTIQLPLDFGSCPQPVVGWGSVMSVDTGIVFKRPVLCLHCNEDYLFTLRAIANNPVLRCHGCGASISLRDRVYEPLLRDVRNTLQSLDSFQKLTMSQPAA